MGLVQIGGEIRAKPLNDNFQYLDGKLLFGPESNRPNPGVTNRLYVTIDTGIVYADTGTDWIQVGGLSEIDWGSIAGKPSTFPPSPHASEHAAGGSDPITPAMIGAETPTGAQVKANQAEANAKDWVKGFGLGITAVPFGIDWNAITETGCYAGNTNGPIGAAVVFGLHVNHLSTYSLQVVGRQNNAYMRTRENGVWGAWQKIYHDGNAGPFYRGAGSPEGVVTAPPGAIYQNTNGGQGTTVYYKASGTGNTGWRAIA